MSEHKEEEQYISEKDAASMAMVLRAAAATLESFANPPDIQFVNALPVETQRELGKLLGGSTRSHPYTPPYGCGTRVDIIEAISCIIGRVRVESQVMRPPENGELG